MAGSDDEIAEGEWTELPAETADVEDTPDGGAIVKLDDEAGELAEDPEFYANLTDGTIPDRTLNELATKLTDLIEKDKKAREKRDEQQAEGIQRTGLANDAPGGAKFQGASKVVHPMLIEACVDFAARAIQELFPASGPAKDFIPGKVTSEKVAKAKRKTELMNWQLTVQVQEFRAELEQLLTQLPLGGVQYLHMDWESRRNRPKPTFVPVDDMLLPFAATNFYSAHRKTHVQYLTQEEFEARVRAGRYRAIDLVPESFGPEETKSGTASNKVEGREASSYNEDGLRTVFEVYAVLDVEEDDRAEGPAPYIITIDKSTNKVASMYRDWAEDDDTCEPLDHYVEFPFIPWRGAYPIGLSQMIGLLSGAATGALRALLDSAHINNSAAMIKLKGRGGGQGINSQSVTLQPTEVHEIDGGVATDDIRKLAMPLPFSPPSPVLFSLLGFLVDAGKGVVRTTLEDVADTNANVPVGTTMARIEQGLVVYKAIHGRLHDSMARVLRILHRLNGLYLDPAKLKYEVGEELATRADFEGPLDVVPVSDPNIFSEAQRYAQVQSLVQRADARPDLYDARKVEERVMETLKIPDPEDLLLPPTQPSEQNAVNENAAAALGRPITAFPHQDHLAHIETHLAFLQSPMLGGNPLISPTFAPVILGHLREHIVLWYVSQVFEVSNEALGQDVGDLIRDLGKDTDARRSLDQMLTEAAYAVIGEGDQTFSQIMPIVQQLQQYVQQMQQQAAAATPQDPAIAVMQADVQRKGAADQAKAANDQAELQQKGQLEQAKLQQTAQERAEKASLAREQLAVRVNDMQLRGMTDAERLATQERIAEEQAAARTRDNREDNQTAIDLAVMDHAHSAQQAEIDALNPDPRPDFLPG